MTSKQLMLRYLINNHVRLENDVVDLRNSFVNRRNATIIDCTELIVALAKYELFSDVFHDIMHIYKISPEELKND